jgi:putative aldouronate transport system substrate-binding protein
LAFTSDTKSEVGAELGQFIWDSGVQFITGAIDEKGWRTAVDRWRKDGGDKITTEYQAQYDAINKKQGEPFYGKKRNSAGCI